MAITKKTYRVDEKPDLTPQQQAELEALKGREIDLSDAPETTDWSQAKRGLSAHQKILQSEQAIQVLDADVMAWLSTQDQETKQHINDMIRHAMALKGVKFA